MDTTIGTTQVAVALSFTTSSVTPIYITKFVSPTLGQTSVAANTWTWQFAVSESALAANYPVTSSGTIPICCYVWRPSTGARIGFILNGNSATNYTEPSAGNTETAETGTFTGSGVTCQNGDVIVIEAICNTSSGGGARTGNFYYDGNTEGSTTSNAAFLSTPETITFGGAGVLNTRNIVPSFCYV